MPSLFGDAGLDLHPENATIKSRGYSYGGQVAQYNTNHRLWECNNKCNTLSSTRKGMAGGTGSTGQTNQRLWDETTKAKIQTNTPWRMTQNWICYRAWAQFLLFRIMGCLTHKLCLQSYATHLSLGRCLGCNGCVCSLMPHIHHWEGVWAAMPSVICKALLCDILLLATYFVGSVTKCFACMLVHI